MGNNQPSSLGSASSTAAVTRSSQSDLNENSALLSTNSTCDNTQRTKTKCPANTSVGANYIVLPKRQFLVVLSTLYFGSFLAALDSTIVSTLLASIASDLKALNSISWAATAYSVAYSAFQPLYGKLSDIYGSRRVLILCTFLFGVGCQVCSMANGMGVLILGRLLSGVGAGGMLSVGSITVSYYVSSRDRGVYKGIGNVVFGLGAASGGIIGSAAEAMKGWRFAFSVQVPMALASIFVLYFNMIERDPSDDGNAPKNSETTDENDRPRQPSSFERLDFMGSFCLASFVCLMMLAITTGGNQFPWMSLPIFAFAIGSVLMISLFFYWETRRAIEPVLPIWLLTERTVLNSCLASFFVTAVAYTYIYFVPIYLAACQGYTPNQVSHRLIFQFIGGPTGSVGAGLIMRKTGRYWSLCVKSAIGTAMTGALWVAMPIVSSRYTNTWYWQGSAFFLNGVCCVSILTITLVSLITAAPDHQATATSAQYTFRGAGSSVGIAVASAIFNNVLSHQLIKNVTGKNAQAVIEKVSKSVSAIYQVPEIYRAGVIESYRVALVWVFAMALLMSTFVIIPTLLMRDLPVDDGQVQREQEEDPVME